MKKWIAAILAVMMVVLCAGCGNSGEISAGDTAKEETEQNTENNDSGKNGKKGSANLDQTYYSYDAGIFIDVPNVQKIASGLSDLYITENETMATWAAAEVDDSDEAAVFEKAMEKLQLGIDNLIKVDSYEVLKSDNKTINGFDMYQFEGKLQCYTDAMDYELPFYGYTFYSNGYACSVIGIAGSYQVPEPDEDSFEYIKNLIDEMAGTVRTEE